MYLAQNTLAPTINSATTTDFHTFTKIIYMMGGRGALIVFEGCDNSGKTTQSRMLADFLQNKSSVELVTFPDRTSFTGKLIDSYLKNNIQLPDNVIHLLFTANRWEQRDKIVKLIESGTTVIVDRYSYSGVAYSCAKGMSLEWCKCGENGLPKPDVVFYLETKSGVSLDNKTFGEERYETLHFQKKVADVFEIIYQHEKNYWCKINGHQPKDHVFNIIQAKTEDTIDRITGRDNQLKKLKW